MLKPQYVKSFPPELATVSCVQPELSPDPEECLRTQLESSDKWCGQGATRMAAEDMGEERQVTPSLDDK
ncbi:hypothetical protein TNCT_551771 [Trichonephila clavata]|uniref:Uncharacterized protein n=1 Tax=Trichonephila clavata TaxID=2740835 RepID=A0A8X6GBV5_TRICU|nr:hypothetical protein TNCT_551771 [Trichonephila clavata]